MRYYCIAGLTQSDRLEIQMKERKTFIINKCLRNGKFCTSSTVRYKRQIVCSICLYRFCNLSVSEISKIVGRPYMTTYDWVHRRTGVNVEKQVSEIKQKIFGN